MTPKPKPLILTCSKGDSHFRYGDGSLKDDQRQRKLLAAALRGLPDGAYTLTIEPFEERRRVRANNFYWKAIDIVVQYERENGVGNGWTKEQWHLHLAYEHNSAILTDTNPVTGEITETRVGLSTRTMPIRPFSEYVDKCLDEFAERYGLLIQPTKAEDWHEREKDEAAA